MNKRLKILILALAILFAYDGIAQSIEKVKITELEKLINESRTPLVINFWATFCKPCIAEMPDLIAEVEAHKTDSVKLVLVSLDLEEAYPSKIKTFLTSRKIRHRVVWLDEFNADYFCPKIDTTWSGSIPATLFVNNKTGYRKFLEQQLSAKSLKKEFEEMVLSR